MEKERIGGRSEHHGGVSRNALVVITATQVRYVTNQREIKFAGKFCALCVIPSFRTGGGANREGRKEGQSESEAGASATA